MSENVDRSTLNPRYEGHRLRDNAREARLSASIAERGIEEPLEGVDKSEIVSSSDRQENLKGSFIQNVDVALAEVTNAESDFSLYTECDCDTMNAASARIGYWQSLGTIKSHDMLCSCDPSFCSVYLLYGFVDGAFRPSVMSRSRFGALRRQVQT